MNMIGERLEEENKQRQVANKEVYEIIESYSTINKAIKQAIELFINRDNIHIPNGWKVAQTQLMLNLQGWRKRLIKTTDTYNAKGMAEYLIFDTEALFKTFIDEMDEVFMQTISTIHDCYDNWYHTPNVDPDFEIQSVYFQKPEIPEMSINLDVLMAMKTEKYVNPRDKILGFLKEPNQEMVLETTYYYQNWRDYVCRTLKPITEDVINAYYTSLKNYDNAVVDLYVKHLNKLLAIYNENKEDVLNQLSEDEKEFEKDLDWYNRAVDYLKVIERG